MVNYSIKVYKAGVFGERPCPDAEVTLIHASGRRWRRTTNHEGIAYFYNIDTGNYRVEIRPPEPWAPLSRYFYISRTGYRTFRVTKLPKEQRSRVEWNVMVRAQDQYGGGPIPNATVVLRGEGERFEGTTNEEGLVTFRGVPTGEYYIDVFPPEPWEEVRGLPEEIPASGSTTIWLAKKEKVFYVLVGDGTYFCKTEDESKAEKAKELMEKHYPDVSWSIKSGTEEELGALPATSCEELIEKEEKKWFVVVGDGTYFCKSQDKSKAEEALEYYKNKFPDIYWEIKEGTVDELGALPTTTCEEVLEKAEKERKETEGYITLAEDPFYGKLLYDPITEAYIFYDYQRMVTRMPTEADFMILGIENPTGWMSDIDTVCRVCKENKEEAGLTDLEMEDMIKAAAKGQVLPITAEEFAIVGAGLFGLARMALSKLTQIGAVTVTEWTYTTTWPGAEAATGILETAAKGLGIFGIISAWHKISKYLGIAKDALLTSLWIGGFTPFICEEATQALGIAIFMARQMKDPDLLEDAINRYEQIVTIGKELTEKFGILNPFTYDAFKLFFQAAQESLEIYRKLPDKIREEKEKEEEEKKAWEEYREERKKFHEDFKAYWEERKKQWEEFMEYWEERKRSWEAFMERDVEKTISIMVNTTADSLRAIYFGVRTGVDTIRILKRLLREITEETTRAKIEKMIEEAQKRIQEISANYDEIASRGLDYASKIEDETMRKSYESYILTLREQIEIELMRAEAEEIPILEGIFKKGYLFIIGYPRYCRIYLNGEDTGKLAPERFVLDPGKYVVKVVRETGEEWEKEVEVKEGETTEVIYWIPRSA